MSTTPEMKVAEQLANLAESHWFNPAVLGRKLSDQPYYTLDRVMELVAHIIRNQSIRHKSEAENGSTTEGLLLAHELDKHIQLIKQQYQFKNIKLPANAGEQKKIIKSLPTPNTNRYSWSEDKANLSK
jgi:hypothetical protein